MAKETKLIQKRKRLVLLDSHAILHRAYHALPEFSSKSGEPTGAIYGLVAMLIKIIEELKPDYLVACYDLPGPTYRHEAYKEYKAQRKKMEDDLAVQINRSRDVFAALNIPIYDKPGFEADDILGTIVERVKKNASLQIVVASGDMDTMQLVDDDRVLVYTLKKGINDTILYDEDAVKKRFGFGPRLLPDYKGLRGDASDNIIGIKGIGEKTAGILISKFGTIEDMYKKLEKGDEVFLKAGVKKRAIELITAGKEEAEFSKMLATIHRDVPIEFKLPAKEFREGVDVDKVMAIFKELDFRTLGNRIKTVLGHKIEADPSESEDKKSSVAMVAVDKERLEKTAAALWILDSSRTNPSQEEILEYAKAENDFDKAEKYIFGELAKQGLSKVYEQIELPLIPVLHKMEAHGIKIDAKLLENLSKDYHKQLSALEKNIWKLSGEEFNINSPKQMGVVLFEKLLIKTKGVKKTAGGALSTRESELEKLKDAHPIVPLILNHRELQKLLSTYIDVIPGLLDKNSRLHAHFLQSGSATGRMASENPNVQNIPIKSELGKAVRKAFIADKGFVLVSLDYSQIELRIAAFMSHDERLIKIFKNNEDVHTSVASAVFDVPMDKVNSEMRRQAKVINFGILYGMGVNALRQNLDSGNGEGISRETAQKFYNEYFSKFSGLANYLKKIKEETAKRGYTETFFGRRRYFEGINSPIPYIKAMAERMAINAPFQGTNADVIKIAMKKIDDYVVKNGYEKDVFLIMQVHDELVLEVRETLVSKIEKDVAKIMETVIDPKDTEGVMLKVAYDHGDNWGDLK